jgi:fibronectin-binding autotransporter adhesin
MKKYRCVLWSLSFSPFDATIISLVLMCAGLWPIAARGNTLSWSGGSGVSGNWNDSANWGAAGTPANGDTLIFGAIATTRLATTNNLSNLVLNQIRFNGSSGGFAVYGNPFTLTNSILATNAAGANTINNNITFSNATITILVSNGVNLTLAGALGGSAGVAKTGQGTLIYSGSTANTDTNLTTVNEGELDLAKTGVAAIAPYGAGLLIGDGIGTDTVRYLGNHEIWSVVTPITISSSGVLDLNGYGDTAAPLTLNGGQITTGTGVLTIDGTVKIGGNGTVSGKIALGSTLIFTNTDAASVLQMNAGVSGSYGITKAGGGYLMLSASNSYTGLTVVQQGLLYAQNNFALGTTNSGTVVSNVATLVLDGNIGVTNEALTLNGPGVNSAWGALDVENGTNTWAGPITNNANSTLDAWNPTAALHIAGPISGAGGLELFGSSSGGGSHYFEGAIANTYAGTTTVDARTTLLLNKSNGSDGAVPQNLIINGTVRVLNVNQIANTSAVMVNSGGLLDLAAAYDGIDTLTGSGSVSLSGGDLYLGYGNGSSTFSGVISGPYHLYKEGSGTMTLAGATANTYAGTTFVDHGTLVLNKSVANGAIPGNLVVYSTVRLGANEQIADTASIEIQSGGLLDLNNYNETIGTSLTLYESTITTGSGVLSLSPNSTVFEDGTAYAYIYGNVNIGSGNSTWDVEGDLWVPASLSGTANLIKTGQFVLILQSSNSYSGLTIVDDGELSVENPWALGSTSSGTIVNASGNLLMERNTGVTNEPLTLNGPGWGYGNLGSEDGTTNYWVGPITLNGNCHISVVPPEGALHINGPISGAGGIELLAYPQGTFPSGGQLFLEGSTANTYTGITTVDTGFNDYDLQDTSTLVLNKTAGVNAVPTNLVVNGTVRLAHSQQIADAADVLVNTNGLFDLGIYNEYIDTLRGGGTVNFGNGGWIRIGMNNGTSEFDGLFTGTGYAPGYTIGKSGSGTFTIGGNSTYTSGITHVFLGKLVINGSQPQIPVTVDAGSTLGGSGTVGAITANGIISPGNSPGILNSSNVTFTASGQYAVDLNGPTAGAGYDQLNVRGTTSLANASLVVNPGGALPATIGDQFTILNNDGADAITGTFNGLSNGSLFTVGGYTFRINYNGGDGNDVVLSLWGVTNKTVTLNAVDRGWYDDTGYHVPSNGNYLAGRLGPRIYNDWFVFNMPVFSGSIVQAELIINCYTNTSPYDHETYVLRQVTNNISTLEAGGSGLTGIYNDLGEGGIYGIRNVYVAESGERAIIPLNVTFMNDAAAASGSQMALGGSIANLDPTNTRCVFRNSTGATASDVQLRLTFGTALTINGFTSGWYDNTGYHQASNPNYSAGENSGRLFRNFFVFGLPVLSNQLVNAQLLLNSYDNISPSGSENYQLYDVTTPLITLTNSASGAMNTYADLGSGAFYGGRDIYVSESGLKTSVPLNNTFLAAAQANSPGNIALGGVLAPLDPTPNNELLFGYSSAATPSDFRLWLGFLASPVASPVFASGSPTYLGNNKFQLVLSGTSGTTNEIQASFDLQNWDFIRDVGMSSSTVTFYYTNTAFPYRFFRAEPLQ